jgi:predicted transglutaminase-like cysteine proteinase
MSKRFKPGLAGLAFVALLCGAGAAMAGDGIAVNPRYASLGEISTKAYSQPARPLFGMQIAPAMGNVSSKWHAVEAEIEQEEVVLAGCHTDQACPAVARDLLNIAAQGADRTGRARVGWINRAVNLAIIPTSDEAQWGVPDHWSPPFETLQTHRGDCEDYAIVKYAALREAGFSRDDLKIVILHDVMSSEDHAVLAARVDGAWLILDNRTLALARDTDMIKAQPKFVLDQSGAHRLVATL